MTGDQCLLIMEEKDVDLGVRDHKNMFGGVAYFHYLDWSDMSQV